MPVRSYRDLQIFQLSYRLAVEVDRMTHTLPRYEFSEEGSQIRRSSKSISANIAEGYGRRRYRRDYIRFIVYAISSCDETTVHIDFLHDCGHLDEERFQYFSREYDQLGRKLTNFLKALDRG